MVEVRGSRPLSSAITTMLESGREELLIGFAHTSLQPDWLLVVDQCRLADDHEVTRDRHGLHWTGELTSAMYGEASRSGRGLVLMHVHGKRDEVPGLSKTDRQTVEEILPHFGTLLPDVPHAYVVVNETYAGGYVQLGEERRPLDLVRTVTTPIRRWPARCGDGPTLLPRDDRQAAALGARGVRALRAATVGLVGLGGAGSQEGEMLAHAGVGAMVLADADVVEDVNLSRTHGASPDSVGTAKVVVAKAMIERISPETKVIAVDEAFPSHRLLGVLRDADVLLSSVDTPHARNEVNRFALRYAVPLIDVGTTITEESFAVDGHLSVVMPEGHCLRCLGHVSDALLEEEQDAARRGNYGLHEGRPQVVSFNGLLASAAVTEALKLLTGFAGVMEGSREWHYDPIIGVLRRVRIAPGRCRECGWYGLKAASL